MSHVSRNQINPMGLNRRGAMTALAACAASPLTAQAQDFPFKPIRFVVPAGPGSVYDVYLRRLEVDLVKVLGQPMLVDYKPGAVGTLAMDELLKAPADGHTVMVADTNMLGTPQALGFPSRFDPAVSFVPTGLMTIGGHILWANSSLPADTVSTMVAHFKDVAKPINIAVAGLGGATHVLAAELIRITGLKAEIVPYKASGAAFPDLVGGQVDLFIDTYAPGIPMRQAGRIKPLATAAKAKPASEPKLQSFREQGLPIETEIMLFGAVRSETPLPIQRRLHAVISEVAQRPQHLEKLRETGSALRALSHEELIAAARDDRNRMIERAKANGIRAQM